MDRIEVKTNDGGWAFPATNHGLTSGMSLRDWFAGQALPLVMDTAPSTGIGKDVPPAELRGAIAAVAATWAYAIADAMLAERAKAGA